MTATTAQLESLLSPLLTPIPEARAHDFWNEQQWTTMLSLMDAAVPSIRREDPRQWISDPFSITLSAEEYEKAKEHVKKTVIGLDDEEALEKYLAEKPSDIEDFKILLRTSLGQFVKEDARRGLGFIMTTLNSTAGCYLLTGYTTPFHEQTIETRQKILLSWRTSRLPTLRNIYKQVCLIAKNMWIKTSPTFAAISGFPSVPKHYQPGNHHQYEFLQFLSNAEPAVLETDVVIVGSGCGGGVCAKNIAEAGHRVLVAEKSYYFPPIQLPMTELAGNIHLYESGGTINSDDGSITVIAGSTWGGGGTVNWSASLQTQSFVRKEWAEDRGLKFFATADFQESLDRVCDQMGVSDKHVRQNHGNATILEGARRLGLSAHAVPQNTGGKEHFCGHCELGCGMSDKQGPVVSWLPAAAKAGAQFVEGFQIENVIFEETNGVKTAVGVKGVWTSRDKDGHLGGPLSERTKREVIVKAKKVIISCGSLWSPIVLLNSGLKNPQIGKNLYLHPTIQLGAVYKEDVRPWEGGILTAVGTSLDNLDGHGHGTKLERIAMMPGRCMALLPWTSGASLKLQLLKYRHTDIFISIVRDRDPGRVYPDALNGEPRIAYTPSKFDAEHAMKGLIEMAKICYVMGAEEIRAHIEGLPPYIRHPDAHTPVEFAQSSFYTPSPAEEAKLQADFKDPGVADARFAAWLKALEKHGNTPPTVASFASAHQMGTCRMSRTEKEGVVDPKGRVWGTRGLYVADASVFPSGSGVNPMVTNMAICDWISRGIVRELEAEGAEEGV